MRQTYPGEIYFTRGFGGSLQIEIALSAERGNSANRTRCLTLSKNGEIIRIGCTNRTSHIPTESWTRYKSKS